MITLNGHMNTVIKLSCFSMIQKTIFIIQSGVLLPRDCLLLLWKCHAVIDTLDCSSLELREASMENVHVKFCLFSVYIWRALTEVGKDYGIYTLQALMNQSWSHAGVYFSQKHDKRIVAVCRWCNEFIEYVLFVWARFCSLLCLRNRFNAENKQPVLTDFSEHMYALEIAT